MKRYNEIHVGFNYPYYLVTNEKEYGKLLAANGVKDDISLPSTAQAMVTVFPADEAKDGRFMSVYLPLDLKGSDQYVAMVIAHEAMHVWQNIRQALCRPSYTEIPEAMWEMEAYMYEDIFYQLYNGWSNIRKRSRSRKKKK